MNAIEIPVDQIKVFVGRSRADEPFQRMKDSMKERGLKMPIQVRDISSWPASDRRREDGGLYRFELICGQGRLEAAKQLRWKKIAALVVNAPEAEIVGRFLAENMIRKPLPWVEKARLVKAELDAGMSAEEVARRFYITPAHVEKMRRVLSKTAPGLEEDVARLAMNEAESLTTLPAEDQAIVVEVLRETSGLDGNVQAAVAKARAVKQETGSLSATSLRKSLQRVDEELAEVRERLKVTRLHWSLGPQNVKALLEVPAFRKALKSAGVNTAKFEAIK